MSSVLKSQRNESKTDFLEDINKAFIESVVRIDKLPKKRQTIKNKMYDLIFDAQEMIYEGNSIFPTNQHEVQLRRDRFLVAKAKLYALKRNISALKEIEEVNTRSYAYWSGVIQDSINSLNRIVKANRTAYAKLPERTLSKN